MAFHGGVIGVIIAMYFFAKKNKKSFLQVADFVCPLIPIGLMLGRIGNFINGELWGRITTVPWGMIFPATGILPRHPSQIYEALLEGLLLFIFLWIYSEKPRKPGNVSAWFLIGYGIARIICEFFREPDVQIGFIGHWFTEGQLLSFPMILLGIYLLMKKTDKNAIMN
jgi:phosphatidylglycerol:prolipoprotein diacylglycerol transferase